MCDVAVQTSPVTSPDADHTHDVDSECILNDDEIATIDGSHRDLVVTTSPGTSPTTVTQVRVGFDYFE